MPVITMYRRASSIEVFELTQELFDRIRANPDVFPWVEKVEGDQVYLLLAKAQREMGLTPDRVYIAEVGDWLRKVSGNQYYYYAMEPETLKQFYMPASEFMDVFCDTCSHKLQYTFDIDKDGMIHVAVGACDTCIDEGYERGRRGD